MLFTQPEEVMASNGPPRSLRRYSTYCTIHLIEGKCFVAQARPTVTSCSTWPGLFATKFNDASQRSPKEEGQALE
jgi:hypothetical protein